MEPRGVFLTPLKLAVVKPWIHHTRRERMGNWTQRGTYIEQTFTFHLVGIRILITNIHNYTYSIYFVKKITYRDFYVLRPTLWKNNAGNFSLKVARVAPFGKCLTFTRCSGYYLSYLITTIWIILIIHPHYSNGCTKLLAVWFLICRGNSSFIYLCQHHWDVLFLRITDRR